MDWNSLWSGAKEQVDKLSTQFNEVGVPVIKATAEKWAIDTLTAQNKETQKKVEDGMKTLAAQPSTPLGSALGSTIQQAAISVYSPYIVVGVLGVAIVGYILMKKA